MFTFRHLVISGVSCYSWLCLEIVFLVILLPSISRPLRQTLSSEFQCSENSAGKLSSYREGSQISCVWTSSWPKKKAQNRTFLRSCVSLPGPRSCQLLWCRLSPVQTNFLSSVESRNQDGVCCSWGWGLPSQADTCPLVWTVAVSIFFFYTIFSDYGFPAPTHPQLFLHPNLHPFFLSFIRKQASKK
jgi:hypothetical protein